MSAGIGAGRQVELVLEAAVPAGEDHVDARPEVAVDELLVGRQVRCGLRRRQVVHPSRARSARLKASRPRWSRGSGARARGRARPSKGKHRLVLGEEEAEARALREVAHALVGLAGVRDEGERQLPVGVEGPLPARPCERPAGAGPAATARGPSNSRGCRRLHDRRDGEQGKDDQTHGEPQPMSARAQGPGTPPQPIDPSRAYPVPTDMNLPLPQNVPPTYPVHARRTQT